MKVFSAYGPTLVVAIGALIAAGGTFWSGIRQSVSDAENKRLAGQLVEVLYGGAFVVIVAADNDVTEKGFRIFAENPFRLPVYDVKIRIKRAGLKYQNQVEMIEAAKEAGAPMTDLGTFTPRRARDLERRLMAGLYDIDITTRFAAFRERLSIGPTQVDGPVLQMFDDDDKPIDLQLLRKTWG